MASPAIVAPIIQASPGALLQTLATVGIHFIVVKEQVFRSRCSGAGAQQVLSRYSGAGAEHQVHTA